MKSIARKIIKESFKILMIAIILSTFGGIGLRSIEESLYTIVPLIILIPALNNLIGSFGTTTTSKLTTMLYLGKIKEHWWKEKEVWSLGLKLLSIAFVSSVLVGLLSMLISFMQGYAFNNALLIRVVGISTVIGVSLVSVIFFVSVVGSIYIFKKKEDPDNFLVPITTAIGDLGSMLLFALLVALLF